MPISTETRAERAQVALTAYVENKNALAYGQGSSTEEIIDLITDLLHLQASLNDSDEMPEDVLYMAVLLFGAETESPEGSEVYGP